MVRHRRNSVEQPNYFINYPTPCGARFPAINRPWKTINPVAPFVAHPFVAARQIQGKGPQRQTPLLSEPELISYLLNFRWKCVWRII